MAITVTGAATKYARDKILNATLRNTSFTPPATLYLALFLADPGPDMTGSTEISGNGYVREVIAFYAPTTVNSGLPIEAEQCANQGTITYPTATPSAYPSFGGWAIFDASSGGNAWYHGAWNATQNVGAGVAFQVADQAIAIQEV